jgi:hypothetical protein
VIARITEGNEASINLFKSMGFEHIGIMREVGLKFGKLLDVHLMQKIYGTQQIATERMSGVVASQGQVKVSHIYRTRRAEDEKGGDAGRVPVDSTGGPGPKT